MVPTRFISHCLTWPHPPGGPGEPGNGLDGCDWPALCSLRTTGGWTCPERAGRPQPGQREGRGSGKRGRDHGRALGRVRVAQDTRAHSQVPGWGVLWRQVRELGAGCPV